MSLARAFTLLLVLASLTTPSKGSAECVADSVWLPNTPQVISTAPPPPHPAPDCPFYKAAWQTMLVATQSGQNGEPRFLMEYSTVDDLFGANASVGFATKAQGRLSLAPRTLQRPNEKLLSERLKATSISAGVNQAGTLRGLLIDQNGNPIYYAIHVNDVYVQFIKQNGLLTKEALLKADSDAIEFPTGAVELKSAWQIIDGPAPANYLTARALVPVLQIKDGDIAVSSATREVTVALIALHVVFVLKNHPEFIWSTFEHIGSNGQGSRDNAPDASVNPKDLAATSIVSQSDWLLYKGGTTAAQANMPNSPQDRLNTFDIKLQKFVRGGKALQTSVFRAYPASKATSIEPDDDIESLNGNVRKLFAAHSLADKRGNYQLVGAVWLNDPSIFHSGMFFQNKDGQGSDDEGAMLAGEDALSSTAMESFTQLDQPNCFSCHNTKRVTDDRTGTQLMPAKRLNVSHVLSKFLSESN